SRGLQDHRRAAGRVKEVGRAAPAEMGGRREEGRRRSRRDLERAAGVTDAIQRGLLKPSLPCQGEAAARSAAGGEVRRLALPLPHPPLRGGPPAGEGWLQSLDAVSCWKPTLPFPEFPSLKMRRRAMRW